jgi:hypothetical protein
VIHHLKNSSNEGASLVIVLAFVLLLSGLVVAYLARSGLDRQLAQSGFQDSNSDLLARSALNIIVADFKNEIANGGLVTVNNIQPQRWGTPPPGATPFPNLIRRSVQGDPTGRTSILGSGPAPSGTPKRGEIPTRRWNSHYLIPARLHRVTIRHRSGNFVAPDWVFTSQHKDRCNARS